MKSYIKSLFISLVICTSFAQAQNILVATTAETDTTIIDNAYNEFVNYSGGTVTDARGTLGSLSSSPTPNFSGYDIVVIIATYYSLEADEMVALQAAINSKASTAFVLFFDGCCASNGSQLVDVINASNSVGITATADVISPIVSPPVDFQSTSSPLATGFPSTLSGYYYTPFLGVPSGNIIYTDPTNGDADVGFIIPITESKGSCVFGMADTSPFDVHSVFTTDFYNANVGTVAPAFVSAATDQNGACFLRGTPAQTGDPRKIPSIGFLGLVVMMLSLLTVAYKRNKKS